ncbi:TIGR03790 family protein [Sulfuriroseicoccus oceanibius]|uniref:TIGR03790 family protein n=1 Tax=Sulfuriroseicoccus oceanibius TaxID=2707525 RepID=A0A6B3LG43_9BACT|nr:TIGR03790 family protein [Sulfuriroseicoccus oceanibius]QQL44936.1 TIGR03790 family protein [Sulfuriroseicoccus oceanibius]
MPRIVSHFLALLVLGALLLQPALARRTAPPEIDRSQVLVVFNQNEQASRELAEHYATARNIPRENLLGLRCSEKETITRSEFITSIERPIRDHLSKNKLWQLARTRQGTQEAVASKIKVIVMIKGVPLRVSRDALEIEGKKGTFKANEAAIDSELAALGLIDHPTTGFVRNPYFKKDQSITEANIPWLFLVGRIDGPSYKIARRMIDDAIQVEKSGLWGMGVVDLAGKFPLGEAWLKNIYKANWKAGIPTLIDRHKPTIPSHYPLRDTAVYFGWYSGHRDGPLMNPDWKFKQGAVAVHLHSFSAATVRTTDKHWVGPILNAGAAATVGNVYEPYLQLTHYFELLHQRLLDGYTLVEAGYMSLPAVSWMNVTMGDPLYRPFARRHELKISPSDLPQDKDYIAIAVAFSSWGRTPMTLHRKLEQAFRRTRNGIYYETIALHHYQQNGFSECIEFLQRAQQIYSSPADKLRCGLLEADALLAKKQKADALDLLRDLKKRYRREPSVKAAEVMLSRLTPKPKPKPATDAKEKKSSQAG